MMQFEKWLHLLPRKATPSSPKGDVITEKGCSPAEKRLIFLYFKGYRQREKIISFPKHNQYVINKGKRIKKLFLKCFIFHNYKSHCISQTGNPSVFLRYNSLWWESGKRKALRFTFCHFDILPDHLTARTYRIKPIKGFLRQEETLYYHFDFRFVRLPIGSYLPLSPEFVSHFSQLRHRANILSFRK